MAEEEKEGEGLGKNKLLIVVLIAVPLLVGVLLAGAFILLAGPGNGMGDLFHDPVAEEKPAYVDEMEEFQVNLADEGGRRFLRVEMFVGYENEAVGEEMDRRMPEVRSEINSLLSEKTVSEVQQPGGHEELKEDLIDMLNGMLVTGEVSDIYFYEILIQ